MTISLELPGDDLMFIVLTLGRLDADLFESLCLLHRPYDSLDKLLNLLVQAADVCVLLCRLLIDLHRLDSAVVLCGKSVENEI
jgi:hypothetical protein